MPLRIDLISPAPRAPFVAVTLSSTLSACAEPPRKEMDQAESDFTDALRFDPNSAGVYLDRANFRKRKRDFAGALHDFEEAIRLDYPEPLDFDLLTASRAEVTWRILRACKDARPFDSARF